MARARAVLLLAAAGAAATNMNGEYMVSTGDKFNVPYNTDYASKGHEYFDVWAPEMATHYGEVFWADQGNQPLPDHIVKRFAGKVMAITGYEQDQVMVIPTGHPGENPEQDVSVPINWAYNHHYMAWMTGAHSELKKVPAAPGDPMAHGATTKNVAVDRPSAASRADPSMPTSQMFSEGNGGESRKSFHGYPNGFAQLIESPTTWHITPMQIDTRNRDCGATPADIKNCTKFTPGPEPRSTRFGRGVPKETNYSGILECPCNGRYGGDPMFYGTEGKTKIVESKYTASSSGNCAAGQDVQDAATCFAVAPTLGIEATHFVNKSVADPKLPPRCSVTPQTDGSAIAYFNSVGAGTCSGSAKTTGEAKSPVGVTMHLALDATSLFKRSEAGKYCENNREDLLKSFRMASSTLADAYAARDQCEEYCWDTSSCWGCSVDCPDEPLVYGVMGPRACQWNAVSSCGLQQLWSGSIAGDITEKDLTGGAATITASGPADVWFGIGFNASRMADSPYTLVVNASGVIEQQIGTCGSEAEHCPGDHLASSIKLESNTVNNGVRTVVMTRPFQGKTNKHYTFSRSKTSIPLIIAVGQTPHFGYHKSHDLAVISLTAAGSSACVCNTGAVGQLCETGGQNCNQFVKDCKHQSPLNYTGVESGDLFAQRNPTCNSRSYVGGLSCCHHKRIMLDADQEIRPELLRYHMKWRFWFQEYVPKIASSGKPSHANLPRIYYQTEANAGEYDIPPAFALPGQPIPGYGNWPVNTPTPGTTCKGTCPNGPDCECEHTITFHFSLSNTRLIYAGGHCHAPACISIELYENKTGTPNLLCRQLPYVGKGNVSADKYDEAGYIALPPCLWSDTGGDGLEPSVWLPANTPMFSIKKNRNTHLGHYGEMASWQMRGVNFPAEADPDLFV